MTEPWLRGTLTELDAVKRQILHALELALEDADRWCAPLTDEQMSARPSGIASVGFHLRHVARSLDRLLTYAEGHQLSPTQLDALRSELNSPQSAADTLEEFRAGITAATNRILTFAPDTYEEPRTVGSQHLPTTVAGLLVHCAEHTQRHIGQAITTAQIVTRER